MAKGREGLVERGAVPVIALLAVVAGFVRAGTPRRPATSAEPPVPKASGIRGRLDSVSLRYPLLRRVLDVQDWFRASDGNLLAAAFAFQAFLSLLPLLLVVVAVVGFFSAGSGGAVAQRVVSELGLSGEPARRMIEAIGVAEESRRVASVVGLAGLLWSGLGVVAALQFALNHVWRVEQRGLRDRVIGLGWLAGAGVLFAAAAAATTALNFVPAALAPVGIVLGLGVNFAFWLWTAKMLPNRDVGWKALVPGALAGAVGLEVLKVVGAVVIPRLVESSSALYGSIGAVFALLAWLMLFGRLLVYTACLNAVLRQEQQ